MMEDPLSMGMSDGDKDRIPVKESDDAGINTPKVREFVTKASEGNERNKVKLLFTFKLIGELHWQMVEEITFPTVTNPFDGEEREDHWQ